MDNSSEFFHTIFSGVSDMSDLTEISFIWDAPVTRSVSLQSEIIENAVSKGADAIMVSIIDAVAQSSLIEEAKSVGCKIIYLDSPSTEEGIVILATDNYTAGRRAGQTMIDQLNEYGIIGGSIGIVNISSFTSSTRLREEGMRSVLETSAFKILDTKYVENDILLASEIASSFIEEFPDLVGLMATNKDLIPVQNFWIPVLQKKSGPDNFRSLKLFYYCSTKSDFGCLQIGHTQSSGNSSNGIFSFSSSY